MFLIVNNDGTREIHNLDKTVKVTEADETLMPNRTTPLFPYRIFVTTAEGEDIIFQTDDKFQCSTVMAGIVGALEEGHKTHTINNPGDINANAIVKRAKALYDGTNYITTIKLVREMTGWGLKDAKQFCDEYIKDPKLETQARKNREAMEAQSQAYREQSAPPPDKQRAMWEKAWDARKDK